MRAITPVIVAASVMLAGISAAAEAQFAGGDQDGGVHSLTLLGMAVSPRAIALGEAMAGSKRAGIRWRNNDSNGKAPRIARRLPISPNP